MELGFSNCEKDNKPVAFAISKLDIENANFEDRSQELKDQFGNNVTILQYAVNPVWI